MQIFDITEMLLDLKELEAYRTLEGRPFDFGHGDVPNDLTFGTEEAYWEMEIQEIESVLYDYCDDLIMYYPDTNNINHKNKSTTKKNRYLNKLKSKEKLIQLNHTANWIYVSYDEDKKYYSRRFSGQKVKRDTKQQSRRRVRNRVKALSDFSIKGCEYRRLYDYWWELW
jgi:hypothetical protein